MSKFNLKKYKDRLKDFVKSVQTAYIYKIENKVNGKIYIGLTTRTPSKRWKEHCRMNSETKGRSLIKDAIRFHGKDNFIFSVIEETNRFDMFERESYYIEYYNSLAPDGYNCLRVGSMSEFSESTRKLMSESAKRRDPWNKGVRGVQEAWNKGIPNKKASKPIIATNIKTGEVIEYSSSMEAVRDKGFNSGHITQCCKGKLKQHKGHTFKYKDESR